MNLREQYEKETGLKVLEENEEGQLRTHNYRPHYVRWLEERIAELEQSLAEKDLALKLQGELILRYKKELYEAGITHHNLLVDYQQRGDDMRQYEANVKQLQSQLVSIRNQVVDECKQKVSTWIGRGECDTIMLILESLKEKA